jgi:membrane-bound lytic murein transglycosylase D
MLRIPSKIVFFVAFLGCSVAESAYSQVNPAVSVPAPAQNNDQFNPEDYALSAEQSPIAAALDSLMHLQLFSDRIVQSQRPINKYGYRHDEVPRFSDSVISYRIQHIPSPMKLSYNAHVRGFIELYAVRRKASSERMLGLANYYFPIFEEALERHGLPHQLKYLAIVESALNPVAVSRVGATGLWQFMYPTGKQYGLDADYYCDERRDPWLASDAAARHLKDLHRIYNDWLLALAAYNCGAGNVNKAVRRSGGVTDYWALMPYLPQETRGYVPAFVAVTYIMHYAAEHNLNAVRYTGLSDHIDTLHLKGPLSLPALAAQLGMSAQEICLLNPQFKQQEIPRSFESYPIRLPVLKVAEFERNRSNILAALQPAPVMMPAQDGGASPVLAQGSQVNQPASPASGDWIMKPSRYHSVKKGESLSIIGKRYGVTVQSLRSWNHLSGTNIGVGQKLIVQRTKVPSGAPVVAEQAQASRSANVPAATTKSAAANSSAQASVGNTGSASSAGSTSGFPVASRATGSSANAPAAPAVHAAGQPVNPAGHTATITTSAQHNVKSTDAQSETGVNQGTPSNSATNSATPSAAPTSTPSAAPTTASTVASTVRKAVSYIYYTVRKGDTLWDIAQRKGTTVAELQKTNNLTRSSRLQPGQKLKISAG